MNFLFYSNKSNMVWIGKIYVKLATRITTGTKAMAGG